MIKTLFENQFFQKAFPVILSFLIFQVGFAQNSFRLSGEIRDASTGDLIDFASVSVDEARYGTLSQDGKFSLVLPKGRHTLQISHLGYKRYVEEINLTENQFRKYELAGEIVELDEVIISSDGRDPAYGIIKQTIDNKKKNATPFPEYEYGAYTKAKIGFQEGFDLDSMMKVFISTQKRKPKNEDKDSVEVEDLLPSNILFLSENVSRMHIKAPNKVKEEILSTRISGASDQFSPLGNTFNRFDVYENRAFQGGIAERGIISPISDNAFFFYKYKLLGQIKEDGHKFYKILVIPKRIHDPVFQGLIYIADSSYAVQKLDLFVSKEQAIQVVDTLRIHQEYGQVEEAWLPISTRTHMAFSFKVLVFNFPIEGTFTSLINDYKIGQQEEEKKFGMEQISFADSALSKNRLWWDSIRPLPLSQREYLDYSFKDSVEEVQNSPEYLDSLTRSQKFDLLDFFSGGSYRNYRKKTSWNFIGLSRNSGFNAIEGAYLGQGIDRIWDRKENRQIKLGYRVRYGFANHVFGGKLALDVKSNPKFAESWGVQGGNFVQQFSRPDQINMNISSFFATFFKRSYARLYRKEFVEAYYNRELFNGLKLSLNGRYENRGSLKNSSDYSLFFKDRTYDLNLSTPDHKALITDIRLSFQPFNKYMSLPNSKISMGSNWPLFTFTYSRAWGNEDNQSNYQRIHASVSSQFSLGILGNTSWKLNAGKYLDQSRIFRPDLFHYPGNEVYIHKGSFESFFLMPYYEFSATLPFVEGHVEHAFGGFIFNKIPGIRKLKISEYVGFHVLVQENRQAYMELNAGLEKRILKVIPLRVDFNMRIAGDTRGDKYGFKIYDPGIIGSNGSVSISF